MVKDFNIMNYYFSHDYNTAIDPKITCLLSDHGGMGYGIFWRIVEILHQEKKHVLPLEDYIYSAMAKQMLTTPEKVKEIIADCLEKYKLFVSDGENLWSNRALKNIEELDEKYQKIHDVRSQAGKIGNEIRWNKAKEEKEKAKNTNENIAKSQTNHKTSQTSLKEIKLNKIKDIYIRQDSDQLLKKILGRYRSRISKEATSGEILLTPSIRKTLQDRLSELKPQDLIIAIEGFAQDSWQMKTNGHREPAWFFQSSERLAQYIGFYNKNRKEDFVQWVENYLSD
jgi:hypothetical protein